MMVSERSLAEGEAGDTQAGDAAQTRRHRRRVRRKAKGLRPSQLKFSPLVRACLWLGLPVLLWGGVYLLGRALLP